MHKLLTGAPGEERLLLGNEAIARGAIEAGLGLAATYPGTPSSEISLNLFQISRESDLYFEYSTNEKVAMEITAAAATAGVRSMCMMKHVGLNVAADVLMTLAYMGVNAGMIILTADDPFMFSSQNEQDNRYYSLFAGLPMLEPSSVDEARRMVPAAMALSEELGEPVILRTTTRINHSTGVVALGEITPPVIKGDLVKDPFRYVCVPAVSRKLHIRLLENLEKAAVLSEDSEFNTIEGQGNLGIIANGVSYGYTADAVRELGLTGRAKIFRMGFSHPLPENKILDFLGECEQVLVVEEGEPVMETAVKAMAQTAGLTLPIRGKGKDLLPRTYEFDPVLVKTVMGRAFDVPYNPPAAPDVSDVPAIPMRPPTLCAGCSHRASYYVVKKAAEGMDAFYPSDIGCYTLGFLPPLGMADYVVCMGAAPGTGCGFSRVTDKKIVSFVGDSTFFHSAIGGLMNAVFNGHNLTLVILDNGTTAMTGHQPNPGVDMTLLNMEGFSCISIEAVVRAIGVQHVSVIKPYRIARSIKTMKEALAFEGVSVVISQEPCSLYAKSLKMLNKRPFVVSEKCKNHRTCLDELGCPAFYLHNDRVHIDADLCVGCAVCAQICPEKAIKPLKTAGGNA
ncbi:MAG: indolepyruvate ferredoxin oxidoreductase subunit alpha [Desulfobacterales bacterium]|nr:MAG: indolepyruvate ferredoxin oxidoreductase subunit alpha [Desulfobacterales bacterium]